MSEWWSYRPEDFLLFSPRVYWRMFELHNAALWPLQLLTLAAGVFMLLLLAWRPRGHGRWIAFILAVLWAFVGWSFLWNRYATINWAAAYIAPAFAVEALLLLVAGALSDNLTYGRRGLAAWAGYLLVAFALATQPLLGPLQGRGWASSEIFGIAARSDCDRNAGPAAACPWQALAVAPSDPRALVPPERHDIPDHGGAGSLGALCRRGAHTHGPDRGGRPSTRLTSRA